MKTAMQDLIEYLNGDTYAGVCDIVERAEELLEKEKEQIIDDYRNGKVNGYDAINEGASANITADEYYNKTYNQNK